MSFPTSLTVRTLRGRFVTVPDGRPARGSARVVLENFMQGPTDDCIVAPFDRTYDFVDGTVSINLPSNNDPQWTAGVYRLTLKVGDKEHRQKFDVPYNSTDPIDLADILNIPAVTPGEQYIVLAAKGAPGGVASLDEDGFVFSDQIREGDTLDVSWDAINDKPTEFPPEDHTHPTSEVVGLDTALSSKADLVGGVIPTSQIPAISIVEFLGSVSSQSAMLALTGQKGDFCIRTDQGLEWIITGTNPTQLSSWTSMPLPTASVQSINGVTGIVVLSKTDVGLGNVNNTSDANKPVSTAQQTALDGKANTSHSHSASDVTSGTLVTARGGTGLSSFTADSFLRASSTTDLEFRSAAEVLSDIGAAAVSHTHPTSEVTGLDTALSGKAATSHSHTAGDISSGTLSTARGGTGISAGFTATNYLRASSTTALEFRTPAQVLSDIGAAAASHTHTTSQVTGLDTALTGKLSTSGGTVSGDLGVTGFSGLHGTQVNGDLEVTGFTSMQGVSISGDVQVPNLRTTSGMYIDAGVYYNNVLGAGVIVLDSDDDIPSGTPVGTVIVRTA